jgi:hypothetical protein
MVLSKSGTPGYRRVQAVDFADASPIEVSSSHPKMARQKKNIWVAAGDGDLYEVQASVVVSSPIFFATARSI